MKKSIQTILVLLGAVWLLPVTATASNDQDAMFKKEFPSLYRQVTHELEIKSRVAQLYSALLEASTAAEAFYSGHGRYPSTVSELTGTVHDANKFSWTIRRGGGQEPPLFRAVYRSDNRIEGVCSNREVKLLDETKQLQKSAGCNANRYNRDFVKHADLATFRRYLRALGASDPDSVNYQEVLNAYDQAVSKSCSR